MIEIHDDFKQCLNSYFADIDPNDLNTIVSFFKPEILKKNDIFLKAGKKSTKLSFIKSGLLRIFFGNREERNYPMDFNSRIFCNGSFKFYD